MNERRGARGRLVVIGVGHRDRGDDGIGPAVVDAVSDRTDQVTTFVLEGDLVQLSLLWEPDDDVVIVDASLAPSGQAGVMCEIDPDRLVSSDGMSTHGVSVADAIRLGQQLGRSPERLRVMGIGGHDFDRGPMSQTLRQRVDALADELLALVGSGPNEGTGDSSGSAG